MAGHSHWAGIKHKKGVNDAKRGKIFSKHARAIISAARLGGGDPDANLRLKYAIERAKADNMPKDNIERAVKRGCGESDGASYESVLYEGYLMGGVAVLMDALTDNRNRTAPELRRILEKNGGNLAVGGAVSWMFEQKAVFEVDGDGIGEEELLEIAADAGAEDVQSEGGGFQFADVRKALAARGIAVRRAEITYLPRNPVQIQDLDTGQKVLTALEALEDNDDIQSTFPNFEIDDDLLAQLAG